MKGLVLSLTALLFASQAQAAVEHGCFRRHLSEAKEQNEGRRPKYVELVEKLIAADPARLATYKQAAALVQVDRAPEKESRKISDRLIFLEGLSTIPAFFYDWRARFWQDRGINILCDEFAPISDTPKQQEQLAPADPAPSYRDLDPDEITNGIRQAYDRASFEGVSHEVEAFLVELNRAPQYHCVLRHVLDSVLRAANLAPLHAQAARDKGIDHTPSKLSWDFIKLQLKPLKDSIKLDRQAFPLQASGLTILCGDVPPIPPR